MKQSIVWFATLSASLVVGNAVVGCGTDSSTGGAGATGGSGGMSGSGGGAGAGKGGSAGSGGAAGSAGSGGSSGAGGSAGSAGSAGAGGAKDGGTDTGGGTTLQCGTAMCSPFDDPDLGTLTACCAPGETNACGLSFMGICFTTTPGTSNPLCPDVTLPTQTGGMVTLPGCCTATGVCGGELGTPLGCNPLTPFTGQPGAPCGGDAGQPPPPADSGADVGPPSDAGGDAADTGPRNDASPSDGGSTDSSDARDADARTDGPG